MTTIEIDLAKAKLTFDYLNRRLLRLEVSRTAASEEQLDEAQYLVDLQALEVKRLEIVVKRG